MKKIFFLGLSLSLFSVQANADDFYLSLSGVVGKNKIEPHTNSNKKYTMNLEGGELRVGTYLTPDFRGELGLGYTVGKKKLSEKKSGITTNSKYKLESYSLLLNSYYDFNNHTMAVPYIMGGLGFAKNKGNIKYTSKQGKKSFSKKSFSWQLGAGIDMKAANDIKVGLGYRFRDIKASNSGKLHMVLANIKMDF